MTPSLDLEISSITLLAANIIFCKQKILKMLTLLLTKNKVLAIFLALRSSLLGIFQQFSAPRDGH